eukprot:INCI19132.13.p1 GENE.INCI19132.13~~INCI19132.13.p1  ORF type:complete len:802 (-),score=119.21 INCI19132.13:464-2869(-)
MQLTGTIPSSLASLTNLTHGFALGKMPLSGTIPPGLASLTSLNDEFTLANMPLLTGTIPPGLGSLTSLNYALSLLNMSLLTGTLPPGLASLRNLTQGLYLQNMPLTGTVPPQFGSLTQLPALALVNMQLTGSIPSSFGSFAQMQFLNVSNAPLTGTIPFSVLQHLSQAYHLTLTQTRLDGDVTLQTVSMHHVCLSQNLLGGGFGLLPPENVLTAQPPVETLLLDHNRFTSIDLTPNPKIFWVETALLTAIDISSNPLRLEASPPAALGSYTNLQHVNISNCSMYGTVPSSWGLLTKLVSLDASVNNFSGELPPFIGSLSRLTALNLWGNDLDTVMPASICSLTELLNFSECNVSGQSSSSTQSGDAGWDCSALLSDCAERLTLKCGAGDRCFHTSHAWRPTVFWAIVCAVGVVVLGVAITVVRVVQSRRARQALLDKQSRSRATTIELLQMHLGADGCAESVLLPENSVDMTRDTPCIASGGGGAIYKCTLKLAATKQTEMREAVALKEVHAMQDLVNASGGAAEFAKELAVLMNVKHAHIVTFYGIYQFFDTRPDTVLDRYFLVTQFASHGSLDQHIEADFADGPSVDERLTWALEIALALQYLHGENFVHRDIKPPNVLLHGEHWRCLLTDFGIARSLTAAQALTSRIGTAQFMPPEALSGLADAPADVAVPEPATVELAKKWDVYGFGCLIAAMLNQSAVPYPELDERVVMVKVLLGDLRPEVPEFLGPAMRDLLQLMWLTDPGQRPDMDAVVDTLRSSSTAAAAASSSTRPVSDTSLHSVTVGDELTTPLLHDPSND